MSTCHLCEEPLDTAPVVGTMSRGDRDSRRVCCPRCHLVQVDPQPSAEALRRYYEGDYHRDHPPTTLQVLRADGTVETHEPGTDGHAMAARLMHETRAEAVIGALGLAPGSRVLEIGCAAGDTIAELWKRGVEAHGIEPDEALARKAALRVVPPVVECASLEAFAVRHAPLVSFDAVIAFHVLEHFPKPLQALAFVRSLLRRGGKVYFEVPNTYAPGKPLVGHWQWVHLFDFTPHTLAALLRRAGLDEVVTSTAHGGPIKAWAEDRGAEPRAYEDHGGMSGARLAAKLAEFAALDAAEAANVEPERPALDRFLDGSELATLPPDAEAAIREDLREAREARGEMAQLLRAWDDTCDAIGKLSQQMAAEAQARLETWHADDWIHGYTIGEGSALVRTSACLAHVANAMKLIEVGGVKEGEG